MKILVINCGSSSLKYQLFQMEEEKTLAKGLIERIGSKDSIQTHTLKRKISKTDRIKDHREGLEQALEVLASREEGVIGDKYEISAIGHRVVHGGEDFFESTLITDKVLDTIRACCSLAPLHNPPNLAGIEAAQTLLPDVPQVAVFDTAFHQTIPQKAFLYALPWEYYEKYGVRKYGFHGTSHRYVSSKAAEATGKPIEKLSIITCHLGNGCSITAVKGGNSVDTSMGFTPLEGLIMGTRSGDIDSAVPLFLMKKEDLKPEKMENILNKKSGILGISGVSNDLRDVTEEANKGDKRSILALEAFSYRAKKYIGAYAAAMGGVDVLVFTGGIGENAPEIRSKICEGLDFLGISLDKDKNSGLQGKFGEVNSSSSQADVFVIPTNEELMIAWDTFDIITERRKANV